MRLYRSSASALLVAALPACLLAQSAQKKALTQADWDRWRSINAATLSNDGKWAAYTLTPQVGDGEFVVRATSGTTEYKVPVGPGGGGGRFGGGARPTSPFSADSRYAFVIAQPSKEAVEAAQRAARASRALNAGGAGGATGGAAAPDTTGGPQSLVIVALADGKTTTIAGVRNFRFPKDNGKWLVYSADTGR